MATLVKDRFGFTEQLKVAVMSINTVKVKFAALFSSQKISRFIVTSNLAAHAWSIKFRRK